jgi:hypothetical protein
LTSDAQLIFFARFAKKLDSLDFSLPCRAANDFTVSHETNSLPGNKIYVARLKKFSLQKFAIFEISSTVFRLQELPLLEVLILDENKFFDSSATRVSTTTEAFVG